VLRMVPIARHLSNAGREVGLAVWRLRFRYRGWNAGADPVADVRFAVRQLRNQLGDVPVVLVGHSMGGRAALRAADEPGVIGIVGLAPWVPPGEPHEQIVGRRLLVVHGTRDRTTSAKASRALVDAIRADGLPDPTFVHLRGSGHAMLRRAALWDELTADFVLHAALGAPPRGKLARAIELGDSEL
jgi:pimeloyl-ACP methyl ester carboxylesterase